MADQDSCSFKTHIGILSYLNGMRYIEIPAHIAEVFGGAGKQRLICQVNGSLTMHSGMMPLGEGRCYIMINKKRLVQLGVEPGDEVSIKLSKDNSEYGMPMPEELEVLLEQDEEGHKRFKGLSPGKQRNILHFISTAKASQTRIDRSIKIVDRLKEEPPGKEAIGYVIYGRRPRD